MQSRYMSRVAPALLFTAVAASACSSTSFSEDRSSNTRMAAQSLTPDEECTRMVESSKRTLSAATYNGGSNGSVDLGDGNTATISNSDGVTFDWSATRPIQVVIVRGSPEWASVHYYEPAAHSGNRLSAPKNPDDQDRQFPLTTIKFCYEAEEVTPPDAGTDPPPAGDGSSGGGKSW